jgi:hypothetical protein
MKQFHSARASVYATSLRQSAGDREVFALKQAD